MAKDKISDYSATAASNTDVGGVNIQGTAAISNADNALREILSHLKEMSAGTFPVEDTFTVGDPADLTKRGRLDAGNVTAGQTRVWAGPDYDGTIATLAGTEALTNKTLTSPVLTTPQINDTSADHQYIFAVSELAADRTVTLPLLAASDEFVFKAHNIQAQATWEAGVGTTESLVTPAKIAAAITALVAAPDYGAGNAALAYGAVGTYVFGYMRATGITDNSTYAGSSIEPAGIGSGAGALSDDGEEATYLSKGGSALSGTWRAMGRHNVTSGSTWNRATLFLRTV